EGFKRVCIKNNVNEFHIFNARPERNEIMEVVKKMKEQEVFPSAIITSDSMLNINLLSALYHYNIRIPDDVMTATFNDSFINESFINESASPHQTVVNIHPEYLGEEAGIAMIKLIEDPHIIKKNTIIPTEIIERASTKRQENV